MISQRVLSSLRAASSVLLTLGLALLALPAPSSAARQVPGTWRSDWRPGWLPGDPQAEDGSPTPLWAQRALRADGRAAGLFITLDPVTRLPIAPSAEQKRAMAAQLEHDALVAPAGPLQVERLTGGGELVHLNGQFQVYSIGRRDASGRIRTDCAAGPAAAGKLLSVPAPAPSKWEEK